MSLTNMSKVNVKATPSNCKLSTMHQVVQSYDNIHYNCVFYFYSASALLAICLSVCPSVTLRYCVQTDEATIMRFFTIR